MGTRVKGGANMKMLLVTIMHTIFSTNVDGMVA